MLQFLSNCCPSFGTAANQAASTRSRSASVGSGTGITRSDDRQVIHSQPSGTSQPVVSPTGRQPVDERTQLHKSPPGSVRSFRSNDNEPTAPFAGKKMLIMVRHGKTPDNCGKGEEYQMPAGAVEAGRPIQAGPQQTSGDKVLSGHNDVELTVKGHLQARTAGEQTLDLIGRKRLLDAVYIASPQPRVQQTYQGFVHGAGLADAALNKSDDPRLMERSAGRLTGLTREEATLAWPVLTTDQTPFKRANTRYPEGTALNGKHYPGESLKDVGDRACDLVDKLDGKADTTFLFTHEMTTKAMVQHLESGCTSHEAQTCTTDDTFKQDVPNATPIFFERDSTGWKRIDPLMGQGEPARLAA